MKCSVNELLEKSVIDVISAEKIGSLIDVEIDTQSACISALIVALKKKSGSLLTKYEKIRIDWAFIRKIGKDAILVECQGEWHRLEDEKSFLDKLLN